MRRSLVAAVVLGALALSGCTGSGFYAQPGPPTEVEGEWTGEYQEPGLPEDQVATLRLGSFESYTGVGHSIVRVMGIDDGAITWNFRFVLDDKKISPGAHDVVVLYFSAYWFAGRSYTGTVRFIAEPRHVYEVHAAEEDGKISAWIINSTANEVVARSVDFTRLE